MELCVCKVGDITYMSEFTPPSKQYALCLYYKG
jgi:hypothetical protein